MRYNFHYKGLENIPASEGVLLLGSHVRWVDWAIIQIPIKRRLNFMIDKDIYNWKLFNKALKKGEAIPISQKASKDKNHTQLIKTMLFKSKFALALEEDAQLKNIKDFKKQIELNEFTTKNVLESILAN